MIFYTATDADGRTHWEKTQADARAINKNFEQVDVPVDKPGLHVWLNVMQQKIDETGLHADPAPPAPKPESYTDKSNRFEDEFAAMPVSLQLHYAALAMENAREQLPNTGTDR
jgi:hypothetical protein